jgi:hypothetical protein
MSKSFRNRKSRKSRKSRKFRKSRNRGGASEPITEAILFTVSDMPPGVVRQFRPDYAFGSLPFLKELFIQSVNDYKEEEPEDDTVLEEDIQIHRIRGAEDTVLFEGKIANWTNIQMQTFLSGLQVDDRVHIELIQT